MKKIIAMLMVVLSLSVFAKDYSKFSTNVLVSVEQANEMIKKGGDLVVIDVRTKAKFVMGHIDGAMNIWRPDVEPQDKRFGEITGMRASREELAKLLGSFGATNKTTILLYGDNLDDVRVWWLLNLYGHENIRLIDGGYKAWNAAKLDTKMGTEKLPVAKTYTWATTTDKDTLATMDDVKNAINKPEFIILDTRTPAEHLGEEIKAGAFDKGRIPSNYFIEWNTVLEKDGTFKSYDEIKAIYEKESVTPDKNIIAYCQSGVRSAHTTFVLRELLGYKNVKNYDGSWIEWSYFVKKGEAPVERGPIKK